MRLVPACPPPSLCPYRANVASADERVFGKKEKLSIVVVDCIVVALAAVVVAVVSYCRVAFNSRFFSLVFVRWSFPWHAEKQVFIFMQL